MINRSQIIKQKALQYGFNCGIAQVEFLEKEAPLLEKWLKNGFHGEMQYMENYFDKRLNPKLLVEGSKSVISLSYNYFPSLQQIPNTYKLSKYAYGEDYHLVIKDILKELVAELQEILGEFQYRVLVDSAPVLEKNWAVKSGLGWQGKNGNIITKSQGSFFFLAEIICDLALEYDVPTTNHCGNCRKCIDACPTGAIAEPYVVDGSKCISYATIELKNEIPSYFREKMQDWIFGCDICQDVCPWNRFSKPTSQERFFPREEKLQFTKQEWEELSEETFVTLFKKSAVKRTRFSGLQRNILFQKNINLKNE